MIKLLSITFLFLVLLDARENPFFPAEGETDMPISSNLAQSKEPLKRAALTFPSTARTIEEVSVTYKNLDGAIEKKTIKLNNSIDWHLPLFISQNYSSGETKTSKKKKKKINESSFKKIGALKFISFYSKDKELKLITKDRILRDFLLVKPHRIVCDFKRDVDVRSYTMKIKNKSIVKKLRVGNHDGYYRVVIELDGYYKYKLEKIDNGYLFKLL
jgi:AMIN domain